MSKLAKLQRSNRFCRNCENVTEYRFNRVVGHSECSVCGMRCAANKKYALCWLNEEIGLLKEQIDSSNKRLVFLVKLKEDIDSKKIVFGNVNKEDDGVG